MGGTQSSSDFEFLAPFVLRSFIWGSLILGVTVLGFALYSSFNSAASLEKTYNVSDEGHNQPVIGAIAGGRPIMVKPSQDLEATSEGTFVVTAWVALRSLPERGKKSIIFGKYEKPGNARATPGYALAVSREPEGIRFWIYWTNAKGGYEWYPGRTINLGLRRWYLLSLAYSDNRFLAAYIGIPKPGSKGSLELLGAYDLWKMPLPHSAAEFSFGRDEGSIRPQAGMLGVLHLKKKQKQLKDLLQNITRNFEFEPNHLSSDEILLWVNAREVRSSLADRKIVTLRRR